MQPKNIAFPTDAKLLYTSIVRLGALCRRHAVRLRQSYVRVGKRALIKAQRYPHAKQFKRHRREVKFLRVRLGRIIRDMRRRIEGDEALKAAFAGGLAMAARLRLQKKRRDGPKLYSLHAPETECIGKGKAHELYDSPRCTNGSEDRRSSIPAAMETIHAGYWKTSSRDAITEYACRRSYRVTPRTT